MIVNPPNFRRQALEYLTEKLRLIPQDGDVVMRSMKSWVNMLSDSSVKSFLLPDRGEIIKHDTPTRLTFDNIRLPFARCLLEYRNPPAPVRPGSFHAFKVLIYLEQPVVPGPILLLACYGFAPPQLQGAHVWGPHLAGIGLGNETTVTVEGEDGLIGCGYYKCYGPPGLEAAYASKGTSIHEEVQQNLMDEIRVAAHFCLLCNCNNVSPQKIHEVRQAQQRKAQKKGRAPFNDYYALDISIPSETRPYNDNTPGEPTGRRVRLHTRRGHIRKLPVGYSKPFTWVRAATVGSVKNGQVVNAYRVRPRPDLHPSQLVIPNISEDV